MTYRIERYDRTTRKWVRATLGVKDLSMAKSLVISFGLLHIFRVVNEKTGKIVWTNIGYVRSHGL
jgi:hypothetical protein